MLSRPYRLSKDSQFRYIYKRGTSVVSRNLVLIYAESRRTDFKIGFSVSNKIGKATVRNRLKRLLRESVRQNFHMLKPGYNYVFIASSKFPFSKEADLKTVSGAVENLLRRMPKV